MTIIVIILQALLLFMSNEFNPAVFSIDMVEELKIEVKCLHQEVQNLKLELGLVKQKVDFFVEEVKQIKKFQWIIIGLLMVTIIVSKKSDFIHAISSKFIKNGGV